MAKTTTSNTKAHRSIVKRTSQGGKVKTSALNKNQKRGFKPYRGQGR
jgi:hypothetical protein